jgi:hypothetical protein
MNLLMLLERFRARPELVHALCQDGEDVLLLDVVMYGEVLDEGGAEGEEAGGGEGGAGFGGGY